MINETTNYKIKKPTPDEYYDIALNNDNADIIDGAIKINADAIATKQAIITGGASTIASANLPVKKAVVTDSTGKITVADVTDLELSYVKGVTGALQTQINTKAPTSVVTAHTGDSVIHVTAGDKTAWNAKETPSGAQSKATTALTDAKSYVDGKVKTDVPVNAKFTDTNTVTSINGKTGVIAKADIVALGIPAQDTVVNISGKVDVEAGKGLSTNDYTTVEKNKLAGVDTGANNYTHPSTHPASIITESTTKRFVTDAEKTAWNAKTTDANLIIHEADAVKHITSGERATWNNKVNISTGGVHKNKFVQTDADGNIKKFDTIQSADVPVHSAGLLTSGTIPSGRIGLDIGRASDLTTHAGLSTHISSTERTKWNTVTDKADTSAMNSALETKADTTALNAHTIDKANPHAVTKAQVGLGNVDNTSDSAKPISTATQTALDGVVKNTGDEAIAGLKSFMDGISQKSTQDIGVAGYNYRFVNRLFDVNNVEMFADIITKEADKRTIRKTTIANTDGNSIFKVVLDDMLHENGAYEEAITPPNGAPVLYRYLNPDGTGYSRTPMRDNPESTDVIHKGYLDGRLASLATQTALNGKADKGGAINVGDGIIQKYIDVSDWQRCETSNTTNFVVVSGPARGMNALISETGSGVAGMYTKVAGIGDAGNESGNSSLSFLVPKNWYYKIETPSSTSHTPRAVEHPITL